MATPSNRADSISFSDDIKKRFGHQLPPNVVDELCKLVNDNTHGKCKFCKVPAESLVIGVLQILSDAAKTTNELKENVDVPPIINSDVRANANSNGNVFQEVPMHCSQQISLRSGVQLQEPMNCTRIPLNEITGNHKNGSPVLRDFQMQFPETLLMHRVEGPQHAIKRTRTSNQAFVGARSNVNVSVSARSNLQPQNSKEAAEFLHGLQMNKQTLVFDTPLVKCNGNQMFHESASILANAPITKKKSMVEVGANHMCIAGKSLLDNFVNAKEAIVQPAQVQGGNSVAGVINLSDDIPKSAQVTNRIRIGPGQRFPITQQDVRYYNVICGLAHSQWSGHKAVEFSLTSVTYSSLGESVEPGGKVDNFFVSGICRYFFECAHPRQSKKHFFYPKVGGALYTYNCSFDVQTVQKSFIGANSAHKLHLSHKLCFPIVIDKHWFVFLVDLSNHLFVFLDSYFDSHSNFQKEASSKLVKSFMECWHQYAQGYTNFDDFTICYPHVPKQRNAIDCGIFAVKFMELWDNDIDLRTVFDHSDIPNIRVQLAINMFFSPMNTIDKSIVINLCEQGLNPRVYT